jgi:hypothetical protein
MSSYIPDRVRRQNAPPPAITHFFNSMTEEKKKSTPTSRGRKRKLDQAEDTPYVARAVTKKAKKMITTEDDYIAVALFQAMQMAYEMIIINKRNLTQCLKELIGYEPHPILHKDRAYSRFEAYGCVEEVNLTSALNVVAGATLQRLGFRDSIDQPGVLYGNVVVLKRDEHGVSLPMTEVDEGIIRRAYERAMKELVEETKGT